jgi:hypothetical protein
VSDRRSTQGAAVGDAEVRPNGGLFSAVVAAVVADRRRGVARPCSSICRRAIARARRAASASPSVAETIEPFMRMCQERANDFGLGQSGLFGEAAYDRADVLQVHDARPARGRRGAHLEQDVDE